MPDRCSQRPSYRGFKPCTRRAGHDGPCFVPLSWWGRIKYRRRLK